jgi:glutaredoxin
MSTASKTVVVYSTVGCGYTDMLKQQLDSDGIEYEEVSLSLHPDRWDEVLPHTGGERISPVMIDGDEVTIGFNGIGCYG